MTAEQYSGMYRSSDAYVIPTRGEGWGMPITEVSQCINSQSPHD